MKTREDFLALLNHAKNILVRENIIPFELKQIYYYAKLNSNCERYYKFTVQKKSGATREINAPTEAKQPSIFKDKTKLPHKPKDTFSFLYAFDSSKGIKYLTHDANAIDFTRVALLQIVKEEFEEARRIYVIPESLLSLFHQFAWAKNPKWFTWGLDEKNDVHLGWSCKEVISWCNNEINKNKHPISNFKFNEKMIEPFKNVTEIRKGYLPILFKKLLENGLYKKFTVVYDDSLNKAKFYTHVNIFEAGLIQLFRPFIEHAKLENNYNIQINYQGKEIEGRWMKIIKIVHIGSKPSKNSKEPTILGGYLEDAKKHFNGLCNWSIEAEFEDGFKRINILNDNNKPRTEDLTAKDNVLGFTHILSFYA